MDDRAMPGTTGESGTRLPCPVVYTAEELAQRFRTLLSGIDFTRDLLEMGVGRLSWRKRRRAQDHLTALCVSLWKLTLDRCFPHDAEAFFAHYCNSDALLGVSPQRAAAVRELSLVYLALLEEKKETDFSEVAGHMAEALACSPADDRARRLRMSLRMRALYTLIFENLV